MKKVPVIKQEYSVAEFKKLLLEHGPNGDLPGKSTVPKFRNKIVTIKDPLTGKDIKFQSIKESKFYISLCNQMSGVFQNDDRVKTISRQKTFLLEVNGIRIGSYRADFEVTYWSGRVRVIDVKGYINPKSLHCQLFNMKVTLVFALFGTIVEIE